MWARIRIVSLFIAIAVLLGIAAALLVEDDSEQARVLRAVDGLIVNFEDRKLDDLMARVQLPFELRLDGRPMTLDDAGLRDQAAGVFLQLRHINIRPEDTEVVELADDRARVEMDFHWTVASYLRPDRRLTSEARNSSSRPSRVTMQFNRNGEGWLLAAADLELRQ